MPERLACDEAIRLSPVRLRIPDPDLKQGQVEMFQMTTNRHTIPQPWGIEGGFAVVYKFRTASGQLRALRCFRVPMKPDTQMRYERIGPYFAQYASTITTTFKYYQQGIMIKETVYGTMRETVYPLIEMEWVEGEILLDKVDSLCRQADRKGLEQLIQQWLALLTILRQAKIAHGDLSGNNVIVGPDGRLILIDYDGCYIPDFAGMNPLVSGQPDYQHHQMQQRAFNEHMDHFSALVIYTALVALQAEPMLWHDYMERNKQGKLIGTNLLFQKEDYLSPDQSKLFARLERMSHVQVTASVQALKQACYKKIDVVVFPWEIIDPDYIKQQALAAFKKALARHIIQEIATAYYQKLETAKELSTIQHEVGRQAQNFIQAYTLDQDELVLDNFNQIQSHYAQWFTFTQTERERIQLARTRIDALAKWRTSIRGKCLDEIITNYDPILDQYPSVTPYERNLLTLANEFRQAFQGNDDEALVRFDKKLRGSPYQQILTLTAQEQERMQLAQDRTTALASFRLAIQSTLLEKIISGYDSILQDCINVSQDERDLLTIARSFQQAFDNDDDQQLVAANEKLLHAHNPYSLKLTSQQQERCDLAQKRTQALTHFRSVISQHGQLCDAQQLIAVYDPILDTYPGGITQEERTLLTNARRFVTIEQDLLEAAKKKDIKRIATLYTKDMEVFLINFTPQEQQLLNVASERYHTKTEEQRRLDELLASNAYEEAIRFAREIEKNRRTMIRDARLVLARQRFIRQFDATEVNVKILHDNEIMIHWLWPENDLVETALVLYRPHGWPSPPSPHAKGIPGKIVTRERHEHSGSLRLPYSDTQVYVHVFMAIVDYTKEHANWFYSRGIESTSQAFASL